MGRCFGLIAFGLVVSSSLARADAKAEVARGFTAFIDAVASGTRPAVDLFIVPGFGDEGDGRVRQPVPADVRDTRAMIASRKLAVARVMVSKGGRSAWIAGELRGRVERKGKPKAEPLRVSAFLVKDDAGWHVQATHWSTGEPDVKSEMCGNRDDWTLASSVPKDALPIVKSVYEALETGFTAGEGPTYDTRKFGRILSDDPSAYAIGSAPGERFSGGAKIKSIFKKWEIAPVTGGDAGYPARAALGPDGEMMWIALGVIAPPGLCTSYRTLLVLAKERDGWRIVHQHYSQPSNPF